MVACRRRVSGGPSSSSGRRRAVAPHFTTLASPLPPLSSPTPSHPHLLPFGAPCTVPQTQFQIVEKLVSRRIFPTSSAVNGVAFLPACLSAAATHPPPGVVRVTAVVTELVVHPCRSHREGTEVPKYTP